MVFNLESLMLFDIIEVSLFIIFLSIAIIFVCLIILFFKNSEEKKAAQVIKHLSDLRVGKVVKKEQPILEIKKSEISLKKMLVDKFKPIIEKQLKSKVNIVDFNGKEDSFLALVEVSGVKLLLVLDSSGKIIDYKKSN
ncbi:MAG TPA: hypothetical protein PKK60_01370 [archaeon]|nr:hypothetical protein [archaeon]